MNESVLIERDGPVTTVLLNRPEVRNAVDGPTAAARASPAGTARLASPMERASSASTARPVRMRSIALDTPIRRGSRTVPPSINGTPQRRQKTPNTAVSSATRRSHQNGRAPRR